MDTDNDIDFEKYDGTFETDSLTTRFFAKVIGDENEIHQSDEAAQEAGFDKQVVAGVHSLGWVSQMLAEYGDGTTILLGLDNVFFTHPIYVDDEITVQYGESETEYEDEERIMFRVEKNIAGDQLTCVSGVARVRQM